MYASKKDSGKQISLTNFFKKSAKPTTPIQPNVQKEELPVALVADSPIHSENSRPSMGCKREVDSDEDIAKGSAKRRRVIVSSSDEDDADNGHNAYSEEAIKVRRKLEMDQVIQKRNPLMVKQEIIVQETTPTTLCNPKSIGHAESFIFALKFDESLNASEKISQRSNISYVPKSRSKVMIDGTGENLTARFPHLELEFLKPEKIRDAEKHRPDHPDYDPKTLYVPEDFLKKQTPAHQQWWRMKVTNFDTILFFKVGKFYELFHMDAVLAVANVDLTFMGGSTYAHCGFPEISYGRYSDQLTNRGFKVARVEQTESKKDADDRISKTKCKDKVVRREICRVTTAATRSYGVVEGTDDRQTDGLSDSEAKYLLAISERVTEDLLPTYGICFVDCSTAKFYMSQFKDDRNQSALRTLLSNIMPVEILFERNNMSPATTLMLNTLLGGVHKQALVCEKEFWTAQKTISLLSEDNYLGMNVEEWPDVLKNCIADLNSPISKPNENSSLSLSSLGAIIWFLKSCLIDADMITMRQFSECLPSNLMCKNTILHHRQAQEFWNGRHMVLDGVSLLNLHILPFSSILSGSSRRHASFKLRNPFDLALSKNSLFCTVNRCVTLFGKRLLQQWLCAPSCDPNVIEDRQQAIRTLMSANSFVNHAVEKMRSIPDLERLFQRVHAIGLKRKDHPDDRAQFFESSHYNQRKIKDLVITLDGIEAIQQLRVLYNQEGFGKRSKLLEKCLGDNFPAMEADLDHFKKAFDRSQALSNGKIEPMAGVANDYDEAVTEVSKCEEALKNYLGLQKKKFKCQEIKYFGSGKNRFQLEIPDKVAVGSDYISATPRKGFKRFSTAELVFLVAALTDAENSLKIITDDLTRRVFADFDRRKDNWVGIVKKIATFDCILSLCRYSQTAGVNMCFPELDFKSRDAYLDIRCGQHPCLISNSLDACRARKQIGDFDYIPNDCVLGTKGEPRVILLTGPNMGGKSTLMRQVSSLVVLAHIGSMVPADSMKLTPVDRIFCRIGANDSLSAGQSTFFVELAETNIILKEATKHSLVLIDELGRGTSTFDGTAIACATLKYIADKIQCPTLFSTHYHALCEIMKDNTNIKLAHMACVVDNETNKDPTEENITFLYTLTNGPSLKSYGFYTAKIAGISTEVVRRAFSASEFFARKS